MCDRGGAAEDLASAVIISENNLSLVPLCVPSNLTQAGKCNLTVSLPLHRSPVRHASTRGYRRGRRPGEERVQGHRRAFRLHAVRTHTPNRRPRARVRGRDPPSSSFFSHPRRDAPSPATPRRPEHPPIADPNPRTASSHSQDANPRRQRMVRQRLHTTPPRQPNPRSPTPRPFAHRG